MHMMGCSGVVIGLLPSNRRVEDPNLCGNLRKVVRPNYLWGGQQEPTRPISFPVDKKSTGPALSLKAHSLNRRQGHQMAQKHLGICVHRCTLKAKSVNICKSLTQNIRKLVNVPLLSESAVVESGFSGSSSLLSKRKWGSPEGKKLPRCSHLLPWSIRPTAYCSNSWQPKDFSPVQTDEASSPNQNTCPLKNFK